MNPTPTTPNQPLDARAIKLRATVDELLDMGMDIARTLHRRITRTAEAEREAETAALPPTPGPATDAPDLTLQFDRVARAVRRTVALARALDAPLAPAAAKPQPDPAQQAAKRTAARKRILREVEDSIQNHAEGATADHLHAELSERLDAPDLDDDIAARPVEDIVAEILRDLGIQSMQGYNRWKRRAPAELAHLAARAARRPGDPPLPEPPPRPDPAPLPRSRRFHIPPMPPSIREGLACLAAYEAAAAASQPMEGTLAKPPNPSHQARPRDTLRA